MPTNNYISLCVLLVLVSFNANSQHLFVNPDCADWQKLSNSEKNTLDAHEPSFLTTSDQPSRQRTQGKSLEDVIDTDTPIDAAL